MSSDFGYLGQYGANPNMDRMVRRANWVVRIYNRKINRFPTRKENVVFYEKAQRLFRRIFHGK